MYNEKISGDYVSSNPQKYRYCCVLDCYFLNYISTHNFNLSLKPNLPQLKRVLVALFQSELVITKCMLLLKHPKLKVMIRFVF